MTARGLATEADDDPGHQRLAAGADADRRRPAGAGRRGARRGAVISRGAAVLPDGGRARRAGAVRRRRAGPRGARRARAPRAAEAALHGPDLPQPDRTDAAAGAPRGARPGRRAPWAVDRRGRSVRRAALPRRADRARRVAGRRAGPDDRAVDVVEGVGPGPADRLAADAGGAAPRAGRRQAGRRPAHVHDRPGRGRALARRSATSTRTSRACAPPTARAATRSSTACPRRCPRARAGRGPTAACSCG